PGHIRAVAFRHAGRWQSEVGCGVRATPWRYRPPSLEYEAYRRHTPDRIGLRRTAGRTGSIWGIRMKADNDNKPSLYKRAKPLPVLSADDKGRFSTFVDKSGGPDACWPWTGTADPYGRFK